MVVGTTMMVVLGHGHLVNSFLYGYQFLVQSGLIVMVAHGYGYLLVLLKVLLFFYLVCSLLDKFHRLSSHQLDPEAGDSPVVLTMMQIITEMHYDLLRFMVHEIWAML